MPMRFRLAFARKLQLVLLRERLRAGHRRHACLTAGGCRDDDRGKHRRQIRQRGLLFHFDLPREVALAQVGQFVREHGRILIDVLGREIQAEIDADHAAGGRECVDLLRVDQHRMQLPVLQVRMFGEAVELRFGVVLQDRVADGRNFRVHLAQQLPADLLLHLERHDGRRAVAKLRQFAADGRGCADVPAHGGQHQQADFLVRSHVGIILKLARNPVRGTRLGPGFTLGTARGKSSVAARGARQKWQGCLCNTRPYVTFESRRWPKPIRSRNRWYWTFRGSIARCRC